MINWKVRLKNPYWWVGLVSAITVPILAAFGMAWEDLTSWDTLGSVFAQFIQNPYLIGLTLLSVIGFLCGGNTDPTTSGLKDSALAMSYTDPKTEDERDLADVMATKDLYDPNDPASYAKHAK